MKNEDESKEVADSNDDVPRLKDVFSWVIFSEVKWLGNSESVRWMRWSGKGKQCALYRGEG